LTHLGKAVSPSGVSDVSTTIEIVALAAALRPLGVTRVVWGALTLEFAAPELPEPAALAEAADPSAPVDAITSAALRLANRGRPAA